eukprot:COSAG04_NODE_1434_length_6785_cov_4.214328_6_plen_462_part_00
MFEGMVQGHPPCFPPNAPSHGIPEGVPGGPPHHAPGAAGPLPQAPDGAYLIDRDSKTFSYVLNYLRDGEPVLPRDPGERELCAREARYYGLGELANACVCPLAGLAAACEVGVAVADILALSNAEIKTLCEEQGLSLVARKRVEASVPLRRQLARRELSDAGVNVLISAGLTPRDINRLDAAAARGLGLKEEDARKLAVKLEFRVTINAWGGGGGGGQYKNGNHGGAGGYAEATFVCEFGEVLGVTVGAAGQASAEQSPEPVPAGGLPNGGSGWKNYTSGGGGGSSHVTSQLRAGEVIVGAGGGGGGTGGSNSSPGGGGGGGTEDGHVGRGGAASAGNGKRKGTAGERGGGKGGDAGDALTRAGACANGAGGKQGSHGEGGHGGAASFKHVEPDTQKTIDASSEAAVNTGDRDAGVGQPGAGGQHGGKAGAAGRVVLVFDGGETRVYDEPGAFSFEVYNVM